MIDSLSDLSENQFQLQNGLKITENDFKHNRDGGILYENLALTTTLLLTVPLSLSIL